MPLSEPLGFSVRETAQLSCGFLATPPTAAFWWFS